MVGIFFEGGSEDRALFFFCNHLGVKCSASFFYDRALFFGWFFV
jgi:hypothetical protein